MASQVKSIASLLNDIRSGELALPDLQRDFVWDEDQIRTLLDSIMRDYPFGSLLFWNTQFVDVVYRNFTSSHKPGQTFETQFKKAGERKLMVLDGQQRLQSLYLAFHGTYTGRRLYFNVTSGAHSNDPEDESTQRYRFEFWRDDEPNRPKRLARVADVVGWSPKYEDEEIDRFVASLNLTVDEEKLAARNLRLLRRIFTTDCVPVTIIDNNVTKAEQAKSINEILDIFVRVNSGGTRLSRSDLMFSLIKTKWSRAREHFDDLQAQLERIGIADIDKDFIIRGLLTISDVSTKFEVSVVEKHWDLLESKFSLLDKALRSTIDFCRSADVRILSSSLLQPVTTLLPVVYYVSRRQNCSVPDAERRNLRTLIYFLLYNRFLGGRSPEARVRYLREALQRQQGEGLPLDRLLQVVAYRQRTHAVLTSAEMVSWDPRLTLNIVQPTAARDTLSWQERAEVDHIFPQSLYRPVHGDLVDDIGNLAYLGKLRNIRKSNEEPVDYFAETSDCDLQRDFLVDDRSLLRPEKFPEFVEIRRLRILEATKDFLGR